MVGHEFDLLALDGGPFGLGGQLFHGRAVFAATFQPLAVEGLAAIEITLEQAVDHHVGIAPDGRSEMGVMAEGQSIVADVVGRIDSLGHGPDGDGRDHVFFGRALDFIEHFVDVAAQLFLTAFDIEVVAERLDEPRNIGQLFHVGQVVYAVHERLGVGLFADIFGHGSVGQQHELLDEVVRLARLLEIDR